ncbi:MAG: VCBS repeat-containing protein, partial [Planctomycetota bacterium]|nr:VCBS repeat-containing protein [Planctomycetota bacterium]
MSSEIHTNGRRSKLRWYFSSYVFALLLLAGFLLRAPNEDTDLANAHQTLTPSAIWKQEKQKEINDYNLCFKKDLVKSDPSQFTHSYEGNRKMAALLADVLANQLVQSQSLQCDLCIEINRAAVKMWEGTQMVFESLGILGDNLLHANRPKEALVEFERMQVMLEGVKSPPLELAKIHDRLGISYLRLGEQSNCIYHHTTQSCIFPLEGTGIHQDPSGAAMAVKHYSTALKLQPKHLTYRWLLNIAYMALGKYPQEVPAQWLIPPKCFKSDYDIGRFVDVAATTGVDAMGLSGGCVVDDFNNDGYMDVVASSSGLRDSLKFFLNRADGTFEDKTEEAQLEGIRGGLNLCHADYNNDGFVDVYVIRGAWQQPPQPFPPNSLLRNNGNGTFDDVTEEAGLLYFAPGLSASWADFDNDGWLDLAVGNESRGTGRFPLQLFRSNRDGTFTECAKKLGVDVVTFIRGIAWGDYNNDGRQDLYISGWNNDGNDDNFLFKNTVDGFENVTMEAGVPGPFSSFATWFWDYNNDGWLDIFTAGAAETSEPVAVMAAFALARGGLGEEPPTRPCNSLYRNNGNGTFTDLAKELKIAMYLMPMGANFGDLDNDGYPDFYIGSGNIDFSNLVPN